jgi:DNA-binding winged helix-turn-helix (wHTH) protein/tetratricopeptide (TPR) repeat protein
MSKESKHFYEFGSFRIDSEERQLLRGQDLIPLTPKAFETLLILIRSSERVVLKDDLMKALWPDSFVEEANLSQNIFVLRKALGETAQDARYIVTVPGRGYRFAQKVRLLSDSEELLVVESESIQSVTIEETQGTQRGGLLARLRLKPLTLLFGSAALIAVIAVAVLAGTYFRRGPAMNADDLVLVSDFVNTTGEPIFDGSLKQALTVKLAESPFFNVALDATTRQTLKLMDRSPDERVVPPLARDVCQREGAKVMVTGTIVRLGDKYVLDLDAVNCLSGAALAHEQIDAPNREKVLNRLGQVILRLRRRLGESISSIRRFDTPIEQATTASLPALKAYTTGDEYRSQGKDKESIQFYKLAIELDPEFATAYARLGAIYNNLQQPALADQYCQQAYERSGHVTEREKFYITVHSTHDTDKAIENYKLWTQVYPHDWIPFNNLSNDYGRIGEPDKAVEAGQQALRLNPNHSFPYVVLARAYQRSSRFAEAKAICEKAKSRNLDGWGTHEILWAVAFVEGDEPGMQRELEWYKGNPMESWLAQHEAGSWMSLGQLRRSRAEYDRAGSLALKQDMKELAAEITLDEGEYEADLEYPQRARSLADQALRLAPESPDRKAYAAIVLARAGDVRRSELLIADLKRQGGLGKLLDDTVLANAEAAVALHRRNPAAAIEQLRPALAYDLATSNDGTSTYYRGLAYLELKEGKEAAVQFQKIVDNRGACGFYWPLAHLGLARANALIGDTDKSRVEYSEFLRLWKDADSDLRILNEAKVEYAKLEAQKR